MEIRKKREYTKNHDEGQHFPHIFEELLEKSSGRKSIGNSKPTTKRLSVSGASLIPVLAKRTGVLKMSTVNVLLDQSQRLNWHCCLLAANILMAAESISKCIDYVCEKAIEMQIVITINF